MCLDEYRLFFEFFNSGLDDFIDYLDASIMSHLYGYVRPMILHEANLEVLSSVCRIIDEVSRGGSDEYETSVLSAVFIKISQDSQSRSVFLTTIRQKETQ